MAQNAIRTDYDDIGFSLNARTTAPLTFAGGVVKTSPGRLIRVVVTTAFTGAAAFLTFYDNALGTATGTPLLVIPTATAIGAVFTVDFPVASGISAVNTSLTAGAVTVAYS